MMDGASLYWPAQRQRNRSLYGLFAVVLAFIALYAYLFPGLLSIAGVSKFAQSWLPLALVSMAQAILMLTGGISLAIGAMVSLGAVIAATTMTGPLGVLPRYYTELMLERLQAKDTTLRDFFDLFNHPNLGPPGNIVGSSTFGKITRTRFPTGEAGSSRQIQLAAKISF